MFSKGGSPIQLESVPLSFKHEVGTAVCIEFDVDLKDAQGQQVVLADSSRSLSQFKNIETFNESQLYMYSSGEHNCCRKKCCQKIFVVEKI